MRFHVLTWTVMLLELPRELLMVGTYIPLHGFASSYALLRYRIRHSVEYR